MLPVLVHFTFTQAWSQAVLYALALAAVLFVARNGWLNTPPGRDAQGKRLQRALVYGAIAAVLVRFGLGYALPSGAFLGEQGRGIPVHTYGLMLALGFLSAVTVAGRLAEREWRRVVHVEGRGLVDVEGPKKREAIGDLAFWVLLGGIGGSRVLFMLVNAGDTARELGRVFGGPAAAIPFGLVKFLVGGGGLVFYGGLIGAALMAFWFARRNGMDFLRLADLAIPTVSLGQVFGRLGCFGAGCCWGDVAGPGVAWAARFPGAEVVRDLLGQHTGAASLAYLSQADDARYVVEATGQVVHAWQPGAVRIGEWVATHGHTLPVHPTQIYEALGQLVIFATLLWARRLRRFHGQIFAAWLMAYAVLRTSVELFRGDTERGTLHGLLQGLGAHGLAERVPLEAWYNVSTSQAIALAMFTFGLTLLLRRRQAGAAAGVGAAPTPA